MTKLTRTQKKARFRRRELMRTARKELSKRIPVMAFEIKLGMWDQSPAMREVLSDLEVTR